MAKKSKRSVPPKKAPKRFVLTIEVQGDGLTCRELRQLDELSVPGGVLLRLKDVADLGYTTGIVQVQVNRVQP